jgi:predicted nucleic acid-binding protein
LSSTATVDIQSDAIISGDRDLLDLVAHEGSPILTPAMMLQRLREQ